MVTSNGLPVYSATYSNVPVYEFNVEGNHVMRRRHDDWINATHILKVADYDKPARTRILEREVQKGIHEKVQGGYGKYQGTWIPLHLGRSLAERNGVLGKLLPIFDFIPGPISPPQAPKHQTAASNKAPRISKSAAAKRHMPPPSQLSEDQYEGISAQLNDDESIGHSEIGSETFMGEEDMIYRQQPGSRKRKRAQEQDFMEQQHTYYADSLLDYFMLSDSDRLYRLEPPAPPEGFMVNRPIDDQGHTALHWGAAMGDIDTIRMFIARGARVDAVNVRGETPLIRAVLFTNNHEKETMSKLVDILQDTIMDRDRYGATVLHHVAMTTKSGSRKKSARYYLNVLLTKLADVLSPREFTHFLESRDQNGDTAVHIVARHNARKCVRTFLGRGVSTDIPNINNETAAEILQRSNAYYRVDDFAVASSSPVQRPSSGGNFLAVNGNNNNNGNPDHRLGTSQKTSSSSFHNTINNNNNASSQYSSHSAQSFTQSFGPMVNDKALQVNLAMEDELRQMDKSYADANAMIEQTARERDTVKKEALRLLGELEGPDGGNAEDEDLGRLRQEYEVYVKANESLLEQDQHRVLHHEVRVREERLRNDPIESSSSGEDKNNNKTASQHQAKLEAAKELAKQQARRRELCKEVVQAQAVAGMGETGGMLRRLVGACLGIEGEDVGALVPEVLKELEVGKGGGEGGGMGEVVVANGVVV
ncbi:MAG: hypothetical protein Q9219_003353 [cf. Caloplaca sp. 3 TL-2023]